MPKNNKHLEKFDNYRGITLQPVLCKLFEKIVMRRLEMWSNENNIIHCLQGANQKKCSCLQSTMLLRETISHNVEKSGKCFVLLLDVKKAFDTVWQDGLFYLLNRYGVAGVAWRILHKLFLGYKCYARVGNTVSIPFYTNQGIHQGSPLSMFLYMIFNNGLLCELNDSIFAPSFCNVPIGALAYADDIALLSRSLLGIQSLANIAYKHARKWRYEFNAKKCVLLLFGNKPTIPTNVYMGNELIPAVKGEKHLGVYLSESNKDITNYWEKRVDSCKAIVYTTQGLGNHIIPVNPIISSKIYQQICVPKLCYGTEVCLLNDNVIC